MAPAIYVWSVMFTLNSRVAIRETFNASSDNEDETLGTGFQSDNIQASNYKYKQGVGA
ncbi:hypothetical protein FRC04_005244 [Tulasnella sp. 424]|nr:hypothetical protein FRC04_005244 [Tulasnella sp. 424]KAG8975681.1 hypothetical protein FRC05_005199 [Tulasnella sp. 425]